MYVKTKEIDPVGGGRAPAAPPWIRQWEVTVIRGFNVHNTQQENYGSKTFSMLSPAKIAQLEVNFLIYKLLLQKGNTLCIFILFLFA